MGEDRVSAERWKVFIGVIAGREEQYAATRGSAGVTEQSFKGLRGSNFRPFDGPWLF